MWGPHRRAAEGSPALPSPRYGLHAAVSAHGWLYGNPKHLGAHCPCEVTPGRRSESPQWLWKSQSLRVLSPVCAYLYGICKIGVKHTVVSKQGSETPEEECACFWGGQVPPLPLGVLPGLKILGIVSWRMQRTCCASWLVQECWEVILRCVSLHTVQDPNFHFHRTACELKTKNLLRCLAWCNLIWQ